MVRAAGSRAESVGLVDPGRRECGIDGRQRKGWFARGRRGCRVPDSGDGDHDLELGEGPGGTGRQTGGQLAESIDRLGPDCVVDGRAVALCVDPTGLSQDAQVVRHGGLVNRAAGGEIAGADGAVGAELMKDRQPCRVGDGLEELDVRVGAALHVVTISNLFDIDKSQYSR